MRRAHARAAGAIAAAMRPHWLELRHFAVLLILVDRGPPDALGPAEELVSHLRTGEPAKLMDLLTRFTYPPGEQA